MKESGSTSLKKAKFQNGIQIFVKNQEAKFTTEIVVQKSFVVPETDDAEMKEEMKEETKEEHYGQTSDAKMEEEPKPEKKERTDGLTADCAHPPGGKCLHCLGINEQNFSAIGHKCHHKGNERCSNCADNEKVIKDAKHISFEHYVHETKSKCKDTHKAD